MRRAILAITLVATIFAVCERANADWNSFWHQVKFDWHRMNAWPEPFVHADRQAARAPFHQMVHNGWQRRTTLGEYHFHLETQELNAAGKLKLHWILTQVPESHRTVYVQRSHLNEGTAARVDSVQRAVVRLVPQGTLPAVYDTHIPPPGTPADLIDSVYRQHRETIPVPRLDDVDLSVQDG